MSSPAESRPLPGGPPYRILVTGTLAIDYVCAYPGLLRSLPRHRGINLSLQLAAFERRFGGCAMNIAYTLKLLGEEPLPVVVAGRDFPGSDYARHLRRHGVRTDGVHVAEAAHSAHGFIFTDREQNQITGFFGGPSAAADTPRWLREHLPAALRREGCGYAILAPDVPGNMIAAARALRRTGVPFLTDPGQNLTDFAAEDARALLDLSDAVMVNEYEYATLRRMAAEGVDALALLVVTRGAQGCFWRCRTDADGEERAATATVVDSTGCGDAFRAGFVHARLRGASLGDAARSGAAAAAIVLETAGTQCHSCGGFRRRYREAWGSAPAWLAPR